MVSETQDRQSFSSIRFLAESQNHAAYVSLPYIHLSKSNNAERIAKLP
jgi:hypothetical protein